MKIKLIISLLAITAVLGFGAPALAADCPQTSWLKGIIVEGETLIPCDCIDSKPDCSEGKTGDCSTCDLNDGFQTIINFTQILLALTGTAALLMFMYGGVLWIIAAGNQEQIQKGKAAIQAAAIGIIIILSAWLIVNFTINALTGGNVGGQAEIFNNIPWFQQPSGVTGGGRLDPELIQQLESSGPL